MNEEARNEELQSETVQDKTPLSSDSPNEAETLHWRELIARYGKYALVGAPLLAFVSKARAIHSKP